MILAAVLGGDVSASRSPAIHEAAFRALGIDGRYRAVSVGARGLPALLRRLRGEGYAYVNVTTPHKAAAAALADARSPFVRAAGAANTLLLRRGRVRAENTDGGGLLAALADLGVAPAGRVVVVTGGGGAAAAAVLALRHAGATVRVVARRPAAARRLGAATYAFDRAGLAAALDGAAALVSAVPARAWRATRVRAGLAGLARGAVVLDMSYGAPSPLLDAVRGRARAADGLGMLVHQAALAVALAVGRAPPLGPLRRAARRAPARAGSPDRRRPRRRYRMPG